MVKTTHVKHNPFKPTLKQRIIHRSIKIVLATFAILAFLLPFATVGGFIYVFLHFIYKLW